jgi:hypothetical protein
MKSNRYVSGNRHLFAAIAFGVLVVLPGALQAQHIHVNAGAFNPAQGAQLYFPNGSTYDTSAGYDVYLTFTNGGSFSNLYQGVGVSFTALASTLDNGGPAFGHAMEGAFLQLQFVSMSGPAGGGFGVWMQDAGNPGSSQLLFTLPVGTANGTNLLALSESDGSPGADPYGHIHGRTFTATKPGLYTLGCRVLDTSSNGVGGGPIHTPSELSFFYFQAGLTISSWEMSSNSFALAFGTTAGKTYYVESSPGLTVPNWTRFAGPFTGNNHLQTAVTNSTATQLFFRLHSN